MDTASAKYLVRIVPRQVSPTNNDPALSKVWHAKRGEAAKPQVVTITRGSADSETIRQSGRAASDAQKQG